MILPSPPCRRRGRLIAVAGAVASLSALVHVCQAHNVYLSAPEEKTSRKSIRPTNAGSSPGPSQQSCMNHNHRGGSGAATKNELFRNHRGGSSREAGSGVRVKPGADTRSMLKHGRLEAVPFDREDEAYSPQEQFRPSKFALVRRAIYLFYLFSAAIFTAIFAYFSTSFRDPYWYRMITCAISSSGAAFIKWGQWASARPDIFPEGLCTVLAMLHSYAPIHAFKHSRQAVEEAFGMPLEEAFESFDPKPIASGSIAQVHKAVFDGKKVAVKVRHPGVSEQIEMDFRIMKKIAEITDNIPALKFLNLGHSMEQFSHTLASQTRLDIEGAHLLLLNHNFRNWKTIGFPKPLFMSEAIIVESWEDGVIISEFIQRYSKWREHKGSSGCDMCGQLTGAYVQLRHFVVDSLLNLTKPIFKALHFGTTTSSSSTVSAEAAAGALQTQQGGGRNTLSFELAHFIVSTGEDLYLKMLLVDNLMHADLHPGNILIHVENGRPRLTLVDAGMVAKLTDTERINFIGLLEAMGTGDGARAGGHVLAFSTSQTCIGEEAAKFIAEVKEVFEVHCRGYHTNVDIGVVLREVLAKVRKYQVRVDVNYATLLINLLCLEGIAGALLPTYNILDRAKPLLAPHSKRIIRPIFRTLFPLLLTFKRMGESALFRVLQAARVVESPNPEDIGLHHLSFGEQLSLPPGVEEAKAKKSKN